MSGKRMYMYRRRLNMTISKIIKLRYIFKLLPQIQPCTDCGCSNDVPMSDTNGFLNYFNLKFKNVCNRTSVFLLGALNLDLDQTAAYLLRI